jgi:hypothetical protein
MGKHSNKRRKVTTQDTVVIPPLLVEPGTVHLGSITRLVARHQLKDRIKILQDVIKTHQPLVNAMKVTQKAYQDGVMEGIRQAAAEREKEEKLCSAYGGAD